MSFRKCVLSVAFMVGCAALAGAQGTYTQIDYPGAVQTAAYGIDSAGDIAGYYQDASGNWHGFLLSGGSYTSIDYPGVLDTYLYGINDIGQIVGIGYVGGSEDVGFRYDSATGAFVAITHSGHYTLPMAINNAGTVAGSRPGEIGGLELLTSGRFIPVAPPHGRTVAEITGITTSGTLSGTSPGDNGDILNFLFDKGQYRKILIPNAPLAYVLGINPGGDALVGEYQPSPTTLFGFVFQSGILQTLQFPGVNFTVAARINAAGEVVGGFTDTNGVSHGFTWTPPADARKR